MNSKAFDEHYWKSPISMLITAFVGLACIAFMFQDGLTTMVQWWSDREEYSHGFLIPVIAIYLIWQRSDRLRELPFEGSWLGLPLLIFGMLLYFLG